MMRNPFKRKKKPEEQLSFKEGMSIKTWQDIIGKNAISKGFVFQDKTLEFWRGLCLIHSELSEMAEDFHVHGEITDNGKEELADTFIRICDFAFRFKIELEEEVIKKMSYNVNRPFRHDKKG